MKRVLAYIAALCIGLPLLLALGLWLWYLTIHADPPRVSPDEIPARRVEQTDSLRTFGPNFLRLSKSGYWLLHIEGEAFERGYAAGRLMPDLLYYQEKVFVDRIREMIPSDSYLKFLRFVLVLFNRNLESYIPEENRREIYGISSSCSEAFNAIGTPYERQLNYHAAHDVGHAMQDYMLVGCSSFGVWNEESADSALLIVRNFDFYVGDDFARNKLITFCTPDSGYRFVSVGWPGMTGVLSGMNEAGLTVTINAAKSTMPVSAATPISILARLILQYASTIGEAYTIASRHKTFVAESLLIGSAADGKAALIEKSPGRIALYEEAGSRIISTNHFQSEAFAHDERNRENIATSDSPFRYRRIEELLNEAGAVTPPQAADILRDDAVNQHTAHHSVIFHPKKRLMWLSTTPDKMGAYAAYNLEGPVDSLNIND